MIAKKKLSKKKILMVIASKNFRDEEYFIPFEILQKEGAEITTASSVSGEVVGIEGGEAMSALILKDVVVKDYDAVIFVGGGGAAEYFDDNEAHRIIEEASGKNKVIAAICIAPVILARAGILRGKNATVWSSVLDKNAIKELKNCGCNVSPERVVKDGNIITADGPSVSEEFAKTVIGALVGK